MLIKNLFKSFTKKVLISKKDSLLLRKMKTYEKGLKKNININKKISNNAPLLKTKEIKIINSESLKPQEAIKMINTDFSIFFSNRQFNLKNFNILLQSLSEKRKLEECEKVFKKMDFYNIKKNNASYSHMIAVCSKTNNLEQAEKYFDEALSVLGLNIYLINAMIFGYSRLKNIKKAENLFKMAKLEKLQIDTPTYTSMINCYKNVGQIKDCWKIFDEMKENNIKTDDVILGLMIRICSFDHQAEKAKKIWEEILDIKYKRLNCLHYNSLIKALATRKDYAEEAILIYEKMEMEKIQPDLDTFINSLLACSKLGNIKMAYEITLKMKEMGFKANKNIFHLLIQTYAEAISNPNLPTDLKQNFFDDSWNIFCKFLDEQKEHLNTPILNSLLNVHISYNKILEAEEIIFPLFENFGIEKNGFTYEGFFKYFLEDNDLKKIRVLFNEIKEDKKLLSFNSLNYCLEAFFKIRDVDLIEEVLDIFVERKQKPFRFHLRNLGKMQNLPNSLYLRLKKFDYKHKNLINGKEKRYVK